MGEETISRLVIDFNINSSGAVSGGKKAEESLRNIKKTAEKTGKPISKVVSSFGRIAFYRAIRTALSGLTGGFREGMSNLYKFSQIAGTTFSSSMDRMSTSLMNIKNSLAVAIAPLVEGIVVPALEKLSGVAMSAANAIARFNAILTGQKTYAIATTGAIKKYNEALQKSVLGFDELNKLNGGSSAYNYSSAFDTEEVGRLSEAEQKVAKVGEKFREIAEIIGNFLKPKIDWVIDNLDTVLLVVGKVALAFATWKLAAGIVSGIQKVSDLLGVGSASKGVIGGLTSISGIVAGLLGAKGIYDLIDGFDVFGTKGYKNCGKICDGLGEVLESIGLLTKNPFIITIGVIVSNIPAAIEEVKNDIQNANSKVMTDPTEAQLKLEAMNGKTYGETGTASNGHSWYVGQKGETLYDVAKKFGVLNSTIKALNPGFELGSSVWGNQIRYKANGGFVNSGELFIAREAGAELVGSVGGHTAVMNNDQIVSAVSTGVYNAVVSAMGNRGGENCVKVYLDSKEIRAGQRRLNKALG